MYPAPKQFDLRRRELIDEARCIRRQLDERAAERSAACPSPPVARPRHASC